jgi:NodT family efflux transporter outer membrane factor (OMF) lipoprotein
MQNKFVFLTLLCILAGCTAVPETQSSQINTPSVWADSKPFVAGARMDANWWQAFGDPVLSEFITTAQQNNPRLAEAKARVEEAKAGRTATRAALLPNIFGLLDAKRYDGGLGTGKKTYSTLDANLNAAWEIDIFGGNQARASAANALLQSAEASEAAVRIALQAEVARNYFDYREQAEQLRLAIASLAAQEKQMGITAAQKQSGDVSDFDNSLAAAQLATIRAILPQWRTAMAASAARINVLLGAAPGTYDARLASPSASSLLPTQILVGAPADILANRPDVVAAERLFAAGEKNRMAAVRGMFPKIDLLGFYGFQSSTLYDTNPWSIGVNLVQPILDFGRVSAQIDAADAQAQQAFAAYQQTMLQAL